MALGDLKTVFVTGGGGDRGQEVATICSGLGMNIVIADIHRQRLDATVAAFAGPALGVAMDVSDPAAWARAKDAAGMRFGAVDLLVNGAAIPPCLAPILARDISTNKTARARQELNIRK